MIAERGVRPRGVVFMGIPWLIKIRRPIAKHVTKNNNRLGGAKPI